MAKIVPTMVRLEEQQHARLKAIAAAHHRSLNKELRFIIERWIEQHPEREDGIA